MSTTIIPSSRSRSSTMRSRSGSIIRPPTPDTSTRLDEMSKAAEDAQGKILEAMALAENLEWSEAAAKYSQALAVDSSFAALLGRCACYSSLGMWNEAKDDATACTEMDDSASEAYRYLAEALMNLGDLPNALSAARTGLSNDAGDEALGKLVVDLQEQLTQQSQPSALDLVSEAMALAENLEWSEAAAKYSQALAVDSSFAALLGRCACYSSLGMWNEAKDDAAACTEMDDSASEAYRYLAEALMNLGDLPNALSAARTGLSNDAGDEALGKLVVDLQEQLTQQSQPSALDLVSEAMALAENLEWSEAAAKYSQALAVESSFAALLGRCGCYSSLGMWNEAKDDAAACTDIQDTGSDAYGNLAISLGNSLPAEPSAGALLGRASVYFTLHMWREAAEDASAALSLDSALVDAYRVLATSQKNLGNAVEALAAAESGLAIYPGEPSLERLVDDLEDLVRIKKVQGVITRASFLKNSMEDYTGAAEVIRSGLDVDPHNARLKGLLLELENKSIAQRVQLAISKALQLQQSHEIDAAMETVNEGLTLNPSDSTLKSIKSDLDEMIALSKVEGIIQQVHALKGRGDLEAALAAAKNGLELDPGNIFLTNLLEGLNGKRVPKLVASAVSEALRLHGEGDNGAALAAVSRGLQADAENKSLLSLKAIIMKSMHQENTAEDDPAADEEDTSDETVDAIAVPESQAAAGETSHAPFLTTDENQPITQTAADESKHNAELLRLKSINECIVEAQDLRAKGDFSGAYDAIERGLQSDASNSFLLSFKSQLETVLKPDRVAALFAEALNLKAEGDLHQALQVTLKGLLLEPSHTELVKLRRQLRFELLNARSTAVLLRVTDFLSEDDFSAASEDVVKALKQDPWSPALKEKSSEIQANAVPKAITAATLQISLSNYSDALEVIQKGLVISPTSADLATLKTDMEAASKQRVTAEVIDRSIELQSNGDYAAALVEVERGLSLDPENDGLGEMKADLDQLIQLQTVKSKVEDIADFRRKSEFLNASSLVADVLTLDAKNNFAKRSKHELDLYKIAQARAAVNTASTFRSQGDYVSALNAIDAGLLISSTDSELINLKTEFETISGPSRMYEALSKAIDLKAKGDLVGTYLAVLDGLKVDKKNTALADILKEIEVPARRGLVEGVLREAHALREKGDIDEALATVKKGFELDKGDTENPVLLATQTELNLLLNYKKIEAIIKEVNGFIDQGNYASALTAVKAGLELDPENNRLKDFSDRICSLSVAEIEKQAASLLAQDDVFGATEAVENCLKTYPENPTLLALLSVSTKASTQYNIDAIISYANLALEAGKIDEAIRLIKEGVALDAADQEILSIDKDLSKKRVQSATSEATALQEKGEYALALEVVDKGLFADPTAVYLKNIRVELFEKVQKIRLDAFVTEMLALLESDADKAFERVNSYISDNGANPTLDGLLSTSKLRILINKVKEQYIEINGSDQEDVSKIEISLAEIDGGLVLDANNSTLKQIATSLKAKKSRVHLRRASKCMAQNEYESAKKEIMLGLLCEPDNASLTKKMSEIDDALKDDGVAISEELQQELQSLSSEDYLGRALECRNEGKYREAVDAVNKGLRVDPSNTILKRIRLDLAEQVKHDDIAERIAKAIELKEQGSLEGAKALAEEGKQLAAEDSAFEEQRNQLNKIIAELARLQLFESIATENHFDDETFPTDSSALVVSPSSLLDLIKVAIHPEILNDVPPIEVVRNSDSMKATFNQSVSSQSAVYEDKIIVRCRSANGNLLLDLGTIMHAIGVAIYMKTPGFHLKESVEDACKAEIVKYLNNRFQTHKEFVAEVFAQYCLDKKRATMRFPRVCGLLDNALDDCYSASLNRLRDDRKAASNLVDPSKLKEIHLKLMPEPCLTTLEVLTEDETKVSGDANPMSCWEKISHIERANTYAVNDGRLKHRYIIGLITEDEEAARLYTQFIGYHLFYDIRMKNSNMCLYDVNDTVLEVNLQNFISNDLENWLTNNMFMLFAAAKGINSKSAGMVDYQDFSSKYEDFCVPVIHGSASDIDLLSRGVTYASWHKFVLNKMSSTQAIQHIGRIASSEGLVFSVEAQAALVAGLSGPYAGPFKLSVVTALWKKMLQTQSDRIFKISPYIGHRKEERIIKFTGLITVGDVEAAMPRDADAVVESLKVKEGDDSDPFFLLEAMIGLDEVKRRIKEVKDNLTLRRYRSQLGIKDVSTGRLDFLFLGNPGTGKTVVAKIIQQILIKIGGFLTSDTFIESSAAKMNSPMDVADLWESNKGGIIFFDEFHQFDNDPNKRGLLKVMVPYFTNPDFNQTVFIGAGYAEETESMLKHVDPGFDSRFPSSVRFMFQDYNREELGRIWDGIVHKNSMICSESVRTVAMNSIMRKQRSMRNPSNGRGVQKHFEVAVTKLNQRVAAMVSSSEFKTSSDESKRNKLREFEEDDMIVEKAVSLEEVWESIVAEYGSNFALMETLFKIKRSVLKQRETGRESVDQKFNFVLTGPPGCGKTTIAKKVLGPFFAALGVIPYGDVIEGTATELQASYVGQTGRQVRDFFDKGWGRVLFIDEISAIAGSGAAFADEAIAEILTITENNPGRFILVVADYPENIAKFMRLNSGLARRFPYTVSISPWDALTSVNVLINMLKSRIDISSHFEFLIKQMEILVNVAFVDKKGKYYGFASGGTVETLSNTIYENFATTTESEVTEDILTVSFDKIRSSLQSLVDGPMGKKGKKAVKADADDGDDENDGDASPEPEAPLASKEDDVIDKYKQAIARVDSMQTFDGQFSEADYVQELAKVLGVSELDARTVRAQYSDAVKKTVEMMSDEEKAAFKFDCPFCKKLNDSECGYLSAPIAWRVEHSITKPNGAGKGVRASKPTTNGKNTVIKVESQAEFDREIQSGLAVVDFTADWCGPSKKMKPLFKRLCKAHPNVKFLQVFDESCREVIQSCEVEAFPTFHFYVDGEKVDELVGADEDDLEAKVEELAEMESKLTSKDPTPESTQQEAKGSFKIIRTLAEFEEEINSGLTAVDYTAEWCGPSKAIGPYFKKLCKTYPNVKFLKVDGDKLRDVIEAYEIEAYPTFHFFVDGEKVDELVGASKEDLEEKIESLAEMKSDSSPVDLTTDTKDPVTALIAAAEKNKQDIVVKLLDQGTNVNGQNKVGSTALIKATDAVNIEMVKLLIARGADVNMKNDSGGTALLVAASKSKGADIAKLLIKQGANVNATNKNGRCALSYALKDLELCQLIMDHGADPNILDKTGKSVLHYAAKNGETDAAELLLKSGAALDIKEDDLIARLLQTSARKGTALFKLLFERGVGVDQADKDGDTPLIFAAALNNLELAKYLVEHQANPGVTNKSGKTAYMFAAENKNDVAAYLLEIGAGMDTCELDPITGGEIRKGDDFPMGGITISDLKHFIARCEKEKGPDALKGKTTDDVCTLFVKEFTYDLQLSYIDQLASDSNTPTPDSTVFISHCWGYNFLEVVGAIEHHFPNDPSRVICGTFKNAIQKVGYTVMILSPWRDPLPFQRAWCVFEAYCTMATKSKFELSWPKEQLAEALYCIKKNKKEIENMVNSIDVKRSCARSEEDKEFIMKAIEKYAGGPEMLTMQVRNEMLTYILQISGTTA